MKILFVEQFSELGGGQRNLLDLLPAVTERGWKALVAAPGSGALLESGPLLEKARAAGAETAAIEFGRYSDGRKTAGEAVQFAFDTARLRRWIGLMDCDLISVGGARLLPGVAMGARGRPVIFQAQHFLGNSRAVWLAGRAIRRARATMIANSKHVAAQFAQYGDARVVYNGVAEIPFAARPGKQRIGLIGRIAPMKGQVDFLRAAALVAREMPQARFVICGAPLLSSDGYMDEVKRLATGLPVDFLGWREDVGAVLEELDLLVAPSTAAEATTRVILEAFSAGVPVTAYAIGGIPEIVRDGENGFLVAECEPGALARKIVDVMKSDLTAVAKRARLDWERKYTIARYREEMMESYERVWSHQRNPSQSVGTNSRM